MVDEWTREKPLSEDELATLRKECVKREEDLGGRCLRKFTCDECSRASICRLAFDGYNTNGDCLYEK